MTTPAPSGAPTPAEFEPEVRHAGTHIELVIPVSPTEATTAGPQALADALTAARDVLDRAIASAEVTPRWAVTRPVDPRLPGYVVEGHFATEAEAHAHIAATVPASGVDPRTVVPLSVPEEVYPILLKAGVLDSALTAAEYAYAETGDTSHEVAVRLLEAARECGLIDRWALSPASGSEDDPADDRLYDVWPIALDSTLIERPPVVGAYVVQFARGLVTGDRFGDVHARRLAEEADE